MSQKASCVAAALAELPVPDHAGISVVQHQKGCLAGSAGSRPPPIVVANFPSQALAADPRQSHSPHWARTARGTLGTAGARQLN
jgi:hypothetical protein